MEARRRSEEAGPGETLPTGWCLGSEEFREELLQQMSVLTGRHYGGPEWKESGEKRAERMVAEELGRRGLGQDDLRRRRKGDPEKLASYQGSVGVFESFCGEDPRGSPAS